MKVLLSGGAGFIGGTTAQLFKAAGHQVAVLDDLSTGHQHNIEGIDLVQMDIGDIDGLDKFLNTQQFDAVIHFAAKLQVGESMEQPYMYFDTNTFKATALIDRVVSAGIKNFIFSSTGAVYGEPEKVPVTEDMLPQPVSPYGLSKYLTEQILHSYQLTRQLNWTAFRYFNAAGAYGRIGQEYPVMSNLVPNVIKALQTGSQFTIFGGDYETPDGTAIRDYIHVEDIARAHVMAAEKMVAGQLINQPVNLGTEKGNSVKEVVAMVEKVTGQHIDIKITPRRPGDNSHVIADNTRAKELFNWQPMHDLERIITDAYQWQEKYLPPAA